MGRKQDASELERALHACRAAFVSVGLFSLFINLLMLVPAIYMLQVYDRVLVTMSGETLLMLTVVVVFLFLVMSLLELVRYRILVRMGNRFDLGLSGRLFQAMFGGGLLTGSRQSAQPLTDLSTLRQFLSGNGLLVFFDAPWVPIYLAVLFLFHPWLGLFATGAGMLLVVLTLIGEKITQPLLSDAAAEQIRANELVEANLRNAEAFHAMGMQAGVRARWLQRHRYYLTGQSLACDRGEALASSARVLRLLAQSLILGLGAWLVLRAELTAGMMIAGSIVMGRALAPIDRMIGSWRGFVSARGAYRRLEELLQRVPREPERMALPRPRGELRLESVSACVPGGRQPVLHSVSFELAAGEHLGIIGPSAAGKSSLIRVMLGIWPVSSGTVRLDGADIASWQRDLLGPCIGYLPQDVELFDGTVAENIARFGEIDSQRVVAAARKAGVHEMILSLVEGYDTVIASGSGLSGGQRQRIALARALYGDPVVVMLDEPNANLDDRGEQALSEAMQTLKREGVTLCVISHRISVLKDMDRLLLLRDGEVQRFGLREEVMAGLAIKPVPAATAEARSFASRAMGTPVGGGNEHCA
ncbi:type I secretion system permease/ATPase [Halomonas daqingensis]|uniref:Type I secretion system permease/ATPase n=1 Tax=Billgrantia desiderata TaxID=52021 RepID=A0AAW4YRU5_9GAMM|nr:type I secretion system permease/ATPase [Halomonas desiderata]MCE8051654.1 type I secretion system permease/ATPase [Halomonas desiderata]